MRSRFVWASVSDKRDVLRSEAEQATTVARALPAHAEPPRQELA